MPSRQDRKLNLYLITVASLEAKLSPGALDIDLEYVWAVRVDANSGEGDYLTADGDDDA